MEDKPEDDQKFVHWVNSDKACACRGRFQLFHFQWCNQINIRCDKCNCMVKPELTGIRLDRPIPHVLARCIYKQGVSYTAFATREDRDLYFAKSECVDK